MQTRRRYDQEDLFVVGHLRDLVPADHVLRRIDDVLDLAWLHEDVRECYTQDKGRPSIDPESAVRLMLAGFVEGIVYDRALMRRAQTDLAIRWFAGYALHETLPDHSSLTRIRLRWGVERFKRIFARVVQQCVEAGLVKGDTVHVDATLMRADVSFESLTTEHIERVLKANAEPSDAAGPEPPETPTKPTGEAPAPAPADKASKPKKRSKTDPDASMATSRKDYHLEPSYKQHTAVDDHAGIIVDAEVTTGEVSEGSQLLEQIERIEQTTGTAIKTVTTDSGYAHGANYRALEESGRTAVIPPQRAGMRAPGKQRIPSSRFKYDAKHQRVICPSGKCLERKARTETDNGYLYRASARDCKSCPLRQRCLPATAKVRTIVIGDGYEALTRARRKKRKGWDDKTRELYNRHRWHVEGAHGRAKTQHGLRRAIRRGLDNVKIQAYLTATVMNLKKLGKYKPGEQPRLAIYRLWRRMAAPWSPQMTMAA